MVCRETNKILEMLKNVIALFMVLSFLPRVVEAPDKLNLSGEDDWPMWGKDACRSATSKSKIKPPLVKLWEVELKGPIGTSPAVSGDLAVIGTGDRLIFKDDGRGWDANKILRSGVNMDDSKIYGINVKTRKIIWEFQSSRPFQRIAHGGGLAPCIDKDRGIVYLGSESDPETKEAVFYALDAYTGKELWKKESSRVHHWSAAITKDGKVFVNNGKNLIALDRPTGKLLWTADGHGHGGSYVPVLSGDTIYFGCRAVDARDGKVIWVCKSEKSYAGSPYGGGTAPYGCGASYAIGDKLVFAGTRDPDGLLALDPSNGGAKWFFDTGGPPKVCSSPVFYNGIVCFTWRRGSTTFGINATDGKLLWKYETEGRRNDGPFAISDGVGFGHRGVEAGGNGLISLIIGLDLKTGEKVWTYPVEAMCAGRHLSLAIANDVLYCGIGNKFMAFVSEGDYRKRDSLKEENKK